MNSAFFKHLNFLMRRADRDYLRAFFPFIRLMVTELARVRAPFPAHIVIIISLFVFILFLFLVFVIRYLFFGTIVYIWSYTFLYFFAYFRGPILFASLCAYFSYYKLACSCLALRVRCTADSGATAAVILPPEDVWYTAPTVKSRGAFLRRYQSRLE